MGWTRNTGQELGQVGDKNTPEMKEAGQESDRDAEKGYLAVKRCSPS